MAGDWYYAQGDQRLGPVSLAELRSYLQSGRIQKGTLIWTDGMSDWSPAGDVRAVSGSDAPNNLQVPMGPPSSGGSAPASPAPAAPGLNLNTGPSAPGAAPGGPSSFRMPAINTEDAGRMLRMAAWPLLAIGLLLVVTSKGCDMLGARHGQYLASRSNYLNNYYSAEAARIRKDRDDYIEEINKNEKMDGADKAKKVEEKEKATKELLEKNDKAATAATKAHADAVREFEPGERWWAYYRGVIFLLGTGMVIIGIIGAHLASEGSDRWVCLVLLGIVIYAIYLSDRWT